MSDPIPVQPREIVDLVYRIVRVDGLDHGDADVLARWVALELIEGRNHLDAVLNDPSELLDAARSAERREGVDPSRSPGYRAAARDGIPVVSARFARLYQASKAFLVAERTLDAAD